MISQVYPVCSMFPWVEGVGMEDVLRKRINMTGMVRLKGCLRLEISGLQMERLIIRLFMT